MAQNILQIRVSDIQLSNGETATLEFSSLSVNLLPYPIDGFSLDDITASHGQLSDFTQTSASQYTVRFTPDPNFVGLASISVAAGAYTTGGQAGAAGVTSLSIDTTGKAILGDEGDNVLRGTGTTDTLFGFGGDDALNSGAGADTMYGGAGNDIYYVGVGDTVVEGADAGVDWVNAAASFVLSPNVENLTLLGQAGLGMGNGLANIINGSDAANTLSGLDGDDQLRGNGGDDTLFGGNGADYLSGGQGADRLSGGAGADTVWGGAGADVFLFQSLADFASGSVLDQIGDFSAAQGDKIDLSAIDANALIGGAQLFDFIGTTAFSGQAGQLRYQSVGGGNLRVEGDTNGDKVADLQFNLGAPSLSAGDFADTTAPALQFPILFFLPPGPGQSTTVTFRFSEKVVDFTLSDLVTQNVTLSNFTALADGATYTALLTPAVNFVGKGVISLANGSYTDVQGYAGLGLSTSFDVNTGVGPDKIITGTSGDDVLRATGSNDTLYGLEGRDTLQSGAGQDRMVGGPGDDLYYVGAGDTVVEAPDEGRDQIVTAIQIDVLTQNVEDVRLEGTANINVTGNELANSLMGNPGDNELFGLGGDDVLNGSAGNDTLVGGAGDDSLSGGQDADLLIGGEGADSLTGDAGADIFRFQALTDFGAAPARLDQINDFSGVSGQGDKIDLAFDADTVTPGLQTFAFIGTNPFTGVAGQLRYGLSVWNEATVVEGDVNGDRVADFQLRIVGVPFGPAAVTAADFNLTPAPIPPTVQLSASDSQLAVGETALITIQFSEPVIDFTLADLSASNALLSNFTKVDGDTFTVVATPTPNFTGTADLAVAAGGYADADGNAGGGAQLSLAVNTAGAGKVINGAPGNDSLHGTGTNDSLYGLGGDDVLTSGAGQDYMAGGDGNDTYYVGPGDIVVENPGEGVDWISTSAEYSLQLLPNIENLQLLGGGGIGGTGNAAANVINGNDGANAISGQAGDDTLRGNNGDDVIGGEAGNDYLSGGGGNDILVGGEGGDTMWGGAGGDTFYFQALSEFGTAATGFDQIGLFSAAEGDKIDLSLIDANSIVAGDSAFAWIGTDTFTGAAGQLRYQSIGGGNLRVEADLDGDKIADFQFFAGAASLSATDFIL